LAVGDTAPSISSTKERHPDARGQCATPVVLYVFAGPAGSSARRLGRGSTPARGAHTLRQGAGCLAGAARRPSCRRLRLQFPLLHDDRGFLQAYGLESAAAGPASPPALYLVGRGRRLLWLERPVMSVASSLKAVEKLLARQPSSAAGYPRRVINRWIDRWVH
jgi:hypothetical protein